MTYKFDEHSTAYRATMECTLHLFARFVGKPARLLEVGVYEGGSACWFLDNILTHPNSRYVGVDDNLRWIAMENLDVHADKVFLHKGDSRAVLPKLAGPFNVVHLDGEHTEEAVTLELYNCWKLLRRGGIVLLDDYNRDDYGVKAAADRFHKDTPNCFVIYEDYKLALEKR